jgi:hypothetical protein
VKLAVAQVPTVIYSKRWRRFTSSVIDRSIGWAPFFKRPISDWQQMEMKSPGCGMNDMVFFLDVNVPMYAAGRIIPIESSARLMTEIAEDGCWHDHTEIIQEILYR